MYIIRKIILNRDRLKLRGNLIIIKKIVLSKRFYVHLIITD
jgi:hypothetical protein